ncbi:MAG: hypothetical protein JXE06_05755 [Coriobacteriia bacterium]|nr:hypothetical protein [Coriobacteriia bacterium]MBN2822712.1 hypothetical protein [Coriobacteriia bacterium]
METVATNEFLTWFNMWGSVMYAVMQMVFWAAVAFAAVYAALAYNRYVAHKIARHGVAVVEDAPAAEISIDEFVE